MIKYAQNKNKDGRLYSVSFTANVIKEAPVLILILKVKMMSGIDMILYQ